MKLWAEVFSDGVHMDLWSPCGLQTPSGICGGGKVQAPSALGIQSSKTPGNACFASSVALAISVVASIWAPQ